MGNDRWRWPDAIVRFVGRVSRKNSRAIIRRSAYLPVFFSKFSKRFSSMSIRRQRRIGNEEHPSEVARSQTSSKHASNSLPRTSSTHERRKGREDLQAIFGSAPYCSEMQ